MSRINKLKTMSRKNKLIVLLVFLECIFSFLTYKAFQNGVEFHNNNEVSKNQFNVKYEVDGEYEDWTGSTFPSSDDYELDLESSSCVSKSGSTVSDVLSYTDSKVTVSSNQTLYCTLYFSEKSKIVLPEGLSIGDFVTYDAGTWTAEEIASIQVGPNSSLVSANNSLDSPGANYQFGGFTVGTSRNSGAKENSASYVYAKMYDNGDSNNQVPISGWRIWDIDEENQIVTIVSAANPEDYYIRNNGNAATYVLSGIINPNWSGASTAETTYTIRDWSMYENDMYGASNARVLNESDLVNWYNKNIDVSVTTLLYDSTNFQKIYSEPYRKYQNLVDNHTYYWLPKTDETTAITRITPSVPSVDAGQYTFLGVRILVNLPFDSLSVAENIETRTVTLNGMTKKSGTYGPETTQTYNIWKLPKEINAVSFAEDSWETIAEAVQSGNYPYEVGDTKCVALNGFTTTNNNGCSNGEFKIRIANTSTPSDCSNTGYSQTACGFVLEFADTITNYKMNTTQTNAGGWPQTISRTYLNDTIYNALPDGLKSLITDTYVVSGGNSGSNYTTTDKMYLLSTKEIFGTANSYDKVNTETRQLDYYSNLGVTTSANRNVVIKLHNNGEYADACYWLRSPRYNYSNTFFLVLYDGTITDSQAPDELGLAPAFRIG